MTQLIGPPELEKGGSGTGWSFWKSFLECPLKYTLSQQEIEDITTESPRRTGTYFHWLMEQYYQGRIQDLEETTAQAPDATANPAWAEALSLFFQYRRKFQPSEFNVVGCEVQIEAKSAETVGILPFTGKVDMVVDIMPEQAAALETSERKLLVAPGLYLLDHKTAGSEARREYDKWLDEIQFSAYQMLWADLHPEVPVQGMLASIAQKSRAKKTAPVHKFRTWVVPFPDAERQAMVRETLLRCKARKDTYGTLVPNPTRCYDYNKRCEHLDSGACNRMEAK